MFDHKTNGSNAYPIISKREPLGVISEQYRKLRTNIEFSSFNEEIKTICITSTFPEEAKTITTLNLGTVYAQSETKTLIIDMDLRKPKIHRAFNLSNQQGLSNIITDDLSKEKAIQTVDEYLDVLPAGKTLPFPSEFLMSKKLKKLLLDLKQSYDRIIIDTPPMSAVTDATIISKLTDGTIMIFASRKTNGDVAQGMLKSLKDNGANVIGGILTRVRKKDHRYNNYYYYNQEKED